MMEQFFNVVIVCAMVESLFSGLWISFYFRVGLPLFRCEVQRVVPGSPRAPVSEEIEAAIPGSIAVPIRFRELSLNEFAFREAFVAGFRMTYTPVMYGNLKFFPDTVRVIGLANWFPVMFTVLIVGASLSWVQAEPIEFIFPVFLFGLLGFIYAIQVIRFRRLAHIAAALGKVS